MRLREFLDHLGVVLLVVVLTALFVAFMLFYRSEADRRGPPPMFEQEQWGDEQW